MLEDLLWFKLVLENVMTMSVDISLSGDGVSLSIISDTSSFSSIGVVTIVGGELLDSNGEDNISMGSSERVLHLLFWFEKCRKQVCVNSWL